MQNTRSCSGLNTCVAARRSVDVSSGGFENAEQRRVINVN